MFRSHTRRAFTLIELLVVIAIIALLSSIILASLSSANAKGRDARRISDIKQIQLALALYYDANSSYPAVIDAAHLVTPGFISTIPTDPSGGTAYTYVAYQSNGNCNSYHLGASLESQNTQLASDANITGGPPSGYTLCAGGASSDFNGSRGVSIQKCSAGDAGSYCYDVTP